MEPYAVVESGGKQHLLKVNDIFQVERLDAEAGSQIDLSPVFAYSDGSSLQVGKPALDDVKVSTTVLEHKRGEKLISFKKKRRKGYSRKMGHRQELTILKVDSITQ